MPLRSTVKKRIRVPAFRASVNSKHFSFTYHDGWKYADPVKPIENPIDALDSDFTHFVLHDAKGNPRFMIHHWANSNGNVNIYGLQRIRTQYRKNRNGTWRWDAEKETEKSKQFQRKLGMHPSEFLLSEFLHRYRKFILAGARIRLVLPTGTDYYGHELARVNSAPLIERFFKKSPVSVDSKVAEEAVYELSLNKRRVREILGLDQKPKLGA